MIFNRLKDLDSDEYRISNLKIGYTQGELHEDFEDFEDGFNSPKHTYWKFTLITFEQDDGQDLDIRLIDWKGTSEFEFNSLESATNKISELCNIDTEEMFGEFFAPSGFSTVALSVMDEPEGYKCMNDVLNNIGGEILLSNASYSIPKEYVNSLFCLREDIDSDVIVIDDDNILVNGTVFDVNNDSTEVISIDIAYLTEDIMNY